jgi:hypothetical protein
MLLDLVEVAKSHSGENLAAAFEKVLVEFGINDKVSKCVPLTYLHYLPCEDPQHYMRQRFE